MSAESYMKKLLDGVDVEWKALGEVGELVRGNGLQKKDFIETGVPAIHYGQIYTYYGLSTTETKSFVSAELAAKLRKVNAGDVVITNTSENLEDVCKALVYLGRQQAVTGGHATIFKPSDIVLGKYFGYFTQTTAFSNEKRKYAKGAKVIDVSANDIAKIQIPIPPLEIQAEIVRILDTFTEITTELTTELTARRKQYEYYRDKLLRFEEGEVEWKPLGEVCDFKNGFAFKSALFRESGLPIIRITNLDGANVGLNDVKYFDPSDYKSGNPLNYPVVKGDILIAMSGATTGKIGYYVDEQIAYLNQRVGKFVPKINLLNNRYLFHFLLTRAEAIYTLAGGGAQPNLSSNQLKEKLLVPIPHAESPAKSLEMQSEIAFILDKFDTLTTSITEGLPREIELRRKQYEYYRDLLLSFPRPGGE